jgi:hypothetical protein
MNGEVKYSQFTRGCWGNHLIPVSLEPKTTQSFCMDQWESDALIQVNSLTMRGHSNIWRNQPQFVTFM